MELVPELTDDVIPAIDAPDEFNVDAAETVQDLLATIDADYGWALATDMVSPDAYRYVWYKSETAEEPRRGACARKCPTRATSASTSAAASSAWRPILLPRPPTRPSRASS